MVEPVISFNHISTKLDCLSARENGEILLQWNLNESLIVEKFRFSGQFQWDISSEYERLLRDFFNRSDCLAAAGITGSALSPSTMQIDLLNTSVMSMDFFDRLIDSDLVSSSGNIRGCFDEQFDGITVGDKLREFLMNEDSENTSLYNEDEKKQLIFAVFKIFACGGSMCQPDSKIDRYDMLKMSYETENSLKEKRDIFKSNFLLL